MTFERLVTSELEESSEFVQSSVTPLVASSIYTHDINDPHRFENTYSGEEGLSVQRETIKRERDGKLTSSFESTSHFFSRFSENSNEIVITIDAREGEISLGERKQEIESEKEDSRKTTSSIFSSSLQTSKGPLLDICTHISREPFVDGSEIISSHLSNSVRGESHEFDSRERRTEFALPCRKEFESIST